MIVLSTLTVKVSAILLLALAGALCLRARSAARHWVLTVGVVSACAAPAIHVLPLLPGVQVAPVGPLAWRAGPVFEAFRLRPYTAPFADPAGGGAVRAAAGREPSGPRSGSSRSAVAMAAIDAVARRLGAAIWLTGSLAGTGVLLIGLTRLRRLRASRPRSR